MIQRNNQRSGYSTLFADKQKSPALDQTLSLNNINPKMIAVGEGFEPPRGG